ncbi:MAG: hypothetical protein DBX05_05075 [Candidatus Poseidoniales archaeon]|nr:MAG: hypothetical protein DBX05_05075 [Candidatus Poseidoniales archaeon]
MEARDDIVVMTEPQWQRLWEKSAIGRRLKGGGLHLLPEEVIFCHHHRHQPLPTDDWIRNNLNLDSSLEARFLILEALRVPGNLIILAKHEHSSKWDTELESWALRWHKEVHPDSADPTAEIRWHHSTEAVDWNELLSWTTTILNKDRIPEVLVIDDEGSIVTYELSICEPEGTLSFNTDALGEYIRAEKESRLDIHEWEMKHVGIPTRWGHRLNPAESSLLDSNTQSITRSVHLDLLSRGLALRSGFKYGTHWRGYSGPVGEDHAPYLIDTPENAPNTWAKACLSARLAAGVNKNLLIAIEGDPIRYLQIDRPPSNRRWTNIHRR